MIFRKECQTNIKWRKLDQSYTQEELNSLFIEKLPEIFESIKIDNYSVMTGGDEKKYIPGNPNYAGNYTGIKK